ncbi:coatomer subunit beta [Acrasis kona]|uniref:Coatomer subunit beta n=1 Tax=Acrasis kona TaxID=1008807 RepID=A0AAW2YMM5_9EUKA
MVHELTTGRKLETLRGHQDIVDNIVVVPRPESDVVQDELIIANSSRGKANKDYNINLWKLSMKKTKEGSSTIAITPFSKIIGHVSGISSLISSTVFLESLDQKVSTVISGSLDGNIRCDIVTGDGHNLGNSKVNNSAGLLYEGVHRESGVIKSTRDVVKITQDQTTQKTKPEAKESNYTNTLLFEMAGHESAVNVLKYGQLEEGEDLYDVLVSGGNDVKIKVWNLSLKGTCTSTLIGHSSSIESLYFNDVLKEIHNKYFGRHHLQNLGHE